VQIEDNGYDFCFDHYPSGFFKTGLRRRLCKVDELMGGEVFDLWARAKNATQWRPHGWRA
jgi:hypothetical protein